MPEFEQEKKRRIAFETVRLAIAMGALFLGVFIVFDLTIFVFIQIPALIFYCLLYILFKKKDSMVWRIVFTIVGYCHVGCIAYMAGPDSGIHLLMIGIAPFPALFFGTTKIHTLAVGPILSLFWILIIELQGDLPYALQPNITEETAALLYILALVNSLALSYLFSIFFVFRIQEVERQRHRALVQAGDSERRRAQELTQSLNEKTTLLKEIHHRVKNNLQLSVGIISHQLRNSPVPNAQDIIRSFQDRIRALARVHDHVYGQNESAQVNLKDYLERTVRDLRQDGLAFTGSLELKINAGQEWLALDQAVPCGQLLNELITNSLKHAFSQTTKGIIAITVKMSRGNISLVDYQDNGSGFKAGHRPGTGSELISLLAAQLGLRQGACTSSPSGVHYQFIRDGHSLETPDGDGELLIVEDEILIARNLQANLREQGFTVHDKVLSEATGVLRYLQDCPTLPKLIVMDVKIKGETDGYALAKAIHRLYPQVRFLFSTGYEITELSDQDQSQLGHYAILPKTMDVYETAAAIERLLDE